MERAQTRGMAGRHPGGGRGLCALLAGMLLITTAPAENIGVNFVGGEIFNLTPLGQNEVAEVVTQQFWNNATSGSGSMSLQGDGGGTIAVYHSGLSVTWAAGSGTSQTSITDAGGNSRMMKGFLDGLYSPLANVVPITVTVSNVPASMQSAVYVVIVYFDSANGGYDAVDKITLGAPTYGTNSIYGLDKANVDILPAAPSLAGPWSDATNPMTVPSWLKPTCNSIAFGNNRTRTSGQANICHVAGTITSNCPLSFADVASTGKSRLAGPWVTWPLGSNVEPWQWQ